jgi:hypothetical protein
MADKKITDLPFKTGAIATNDEFIFVDVSENDTVRVTYSDLKSAINNTNTIPSTGSILTDSNALVVSNKTISGATNTFTNIPNSSLSAGIDAVKIGAGTISNTVFGYLAGATSNIQTQINNLGVSVMKFATITGVLSASKDFSITEEQVQTALGVDKKLENSISLQDFSITVFSLTGTPNIYSLENTITYETTQDNGKIHLKGILISSTNAVGAEILVSIVCKLIDASS